MPESRPCKTKKGAPKVSWPNVATARWWIANAPTGETNGLSAYRCPRCGRAHIGGTPT